MVEVQIVDRRQQNIFFTVQKWIDIAECPSSFCPDTLSVEDLTASLLGVVEVDLLCVGLFLQDFPIFQWCSHYTSSHKILKPLFTESTQGSLQKQTHRSPRLLQGGLLAGPWGVVGDMSIG